MASEFSQMFVYDHWANHEVALALRGVKTPVPKSLKLYAHMLAAQETWLARLKSAHTDIPIWPAWTLQECERISGEVKQHWHKYFLNFSPAHLLHSVAYRTSKGEAFHNKVGEILMHVLLHSAHHRGQILMDLRATGHAPPHVDYIHHIRHAQPHL